MPYEYEFDRNKCWYAGSCSLFNKAGCDAGCHRYMEMHFLMNNSGIPKNRQYASELIPNTVDVAAFMRLAEIRNDIESFVRSGESLYIHSYNFGNGKTSWAIKLMQRYFDRIWSGNGFRCRGLFVHVPTFLTKVKDNIGNKDEDFELFKSRLDEVDLVIWDDIAATKLSDFDHSILLTYIDQRVLNGLANIYTGNLDRDELPKALGNRLASRIGNQSEIITFNGVDRRGVR